MESSTNCGAGISVVLFFVGSVSEPPFQSPREGVYACVDLSGPYTTCGVMVSFFSP